MKKMLIGENRVIVAKGRKQERMMDKLSAMMNIEARTPIRYKVTFKTKQGEFFRVLDAFSEEDACRATGVRPEQILTVEVVGEEVRRTRNIKIEEDKP